MSRNYIQHPELFPGMPSYDPYYQDHVRDAANSKRICPVTCAMCASTEHTTEWHHEQVVKDLTREK